MTDRAIKKAATRAKREAASVFWFPVSGF